MRSNTGIWYNYWDSPYKGTEPEFIETTGLSWAKELELNWKIYEKELLNLVADNENNFRSYFSSVRDTGATGWKTITLLTWGIKVNHNLDKCPHLKMLITSTPEWISASINLLEPGTEIKEHSGDTNAIFRCHAGIKIPGNLPGCGFRVKNISRSWEEGKLLVFLDAFPHTAWNHTGSSRIIFLFDILRPEFCSEKKMVCLNVRAFLLLQLLAENFPPIKKFPKGFQKLLFFSIYRLLWVLFPYQQKKGVIRKH